jgi:tRNA 2-thiocytidine biosynthesis protein TtcA
VGLDFLGKECYMTVSIQTDMRPGLMGKKIMRENRPLLTRSVGKALHRYRMIQDGDRIAVGVSGGKDSLTLLDHLFQRRKWVPIQYDLVAVHVDLGFDGTGERIKPYLSQMGIPYHIDKTRIGPLAHSEINRENPCFLCARLRRQRLFELADSMGCAKLALAHHRDDIIETLLINMFYAGEIGTMTPHQTLFEGRFSIIRPLALTDEDAIRRYARARELPVIESGCPGAKGSKRSEIKAILAELAQKNTKVKGNLFRSMQNIRGNYLP